MDWNISMAALHYGNPLSGSGIPEVGIYASEEPPFKRSRIADPVNEFGRAIAILQLHSRIVGIEASLGPSLRTKQCLYCERWAASGFKNCCRFCPLDGPSVRPRLTLS